MNKTCSIHNGICQLIRQPFHNVHHGDDHHAVEDEDGDDYTCGFGVYLWNSYYGWNLEKDGIGESGTGQKWCELY